MNNIANLSEYVNMNKKNPIWYTYDLYSCIAMLFHREHSAILAHIEANKDLYDMDIVQMINIMKLIDDNIVNVELFAGPNTNPDNIDLIEKILTYNDIQFSTKMSFINMYGKGSIGYNYNTGEYYLVDDNYELQRPKILERTLN